LPSALLFASANASAKGPSPSAADAHFRAGRDAAKRGDWTTACAELRESQALEPAPGTVLNLGDCEEHLGHLARAYELFSDARAAFAPTDERAKIAEARAAAVAPRIALVTVRLAAGAPEGTHVEHDGKRVVIGSPAALDPGSTTFDVVAPGRVPRSTRVELRAGDAKELTLAPTDVEKVAVTPAIAPATSTESEPRSDTRRTVGFVLGGVGLAGLATGAVTGILVGIDASKYKQHCPNGSCDADGLSAMSSGKTLQVVSPVAFAIGAACAGAGAYLLLTSSTSGTQAALAATPDGGSILVRRTF
jgi:hypothetical protein